MWQFILTQNISSIFIFSVLGEHCVFAEQDLHNLDIRTDVNFFERNFKEWEKQNVLSSISELKIFITSWFVVFYEIRIFNLLVNSAPGIIGDNLIKYMFGLGQKRVLYHVTAVTCHSFAEYGRLMCFIGPAWLLVAMSFKLLSIEFDLKYA